MFLLRIDACRSHIRLLALGQDPALEGRQHPRAGRYDGRDPRSIKFFATFTPIIGRTDLEAQAKFEELKKHSSKIGGLVLFSGWTGIDISRLELDRDIAAADSLEAHRITSTALPVIK
jgi:alkanesulfonate monooxygenase SsuD/methylene tetrahydromethanopterin reductase-like flavin-dependent oxidoreductase (luciferase family)